MSGSALSFRLESLDGRRELVDLALRDALDALSRGLRNAPAAGCGQQLQRAISEAIGAVETCRRGLA